MQADGIAEFKKAGDGAQVKEGRDIKNQICSIKMQATIHNFDVWQW